jgi:predicted alpha/beta hydrolase
MPAITALCGFFPGKWLGWLEDLPPGVALEWSLRRRRVELSWPMAERADLIGRLAAVTAPILAVTTSDDPFATPAAIRRTLGYYRAAKPIPILLEPADLDVAALGHFGLFNARHASGFWLDTLMWLRDGTNPWPDKLLPEAPEPPDRKDGSSSPQRPDIVRYY